MVRLSEVGSLEQEAMAFTEDIPLLKDLPFSLRVKLHQELPGLAVYTQAPLLFSRSGVGFRA